MRISKKKYDALKSRGRRAGRRVVGGIRGSALQVAAGAVTQLGHTALGSRVGFIGQNWYAGPILIALVGFLAKRKARLAGIGDALLGAAGYAGAQGYALSAASAAAMGETGALYGGGYDAGMLMSPALSGYLNDANDPTSSHYAGAPAMAASDVSEAMSL